MTSVFAAYVTPAGSCWVDFDVYMTQRWADDTTRRAHAHVPADLAFTTKPDLAAAQIRRLVASGLAFGWVAADEVYGRSSKLRATCTDLGLTGVFIVPTMFTITTPAGTTITAAQAGADAQDTFERRSCGTGSKGPRLFDWALVATDDPCQVLLIRRLITRPDQLAYFICHVPDPTKIRLPYLATIAGRRWPVEETFKTGKDVLGWDQSQVRTHTGLHRHTVLTALAALRQIAALTLSTNTPTTGQPATGQPAPPTPRQPHPQPEVPGPADPGPSDHRIPLRDSPVPTHPDQPRPADLGHIKLSVAEHRRLHPLALSKAAGLLTTAAETFHLTWSRRRRHHQAIARWHHYQHHLRQALDPT